MRAAQARPLPPSSSSAARLGAPLLKRGGDDATAAWRKPSSSAFCSRKAAISASRRARSLRPFRGGGGAARTRRQTDFGPRRNPSEGLLAQGRAGRAQFRRRSKIQDLGAPPLGLDRVPDRHREIGAAQALDGAQAGRRGHVDLGQIAVDHVDADEQQAAPLQLRPDAGANLLLARGQLGLPARRRRAPYWSGCRRRPAPG